MSKVSTVYDAVVTALNALYPSGSGWTRIPNPYDIALNDDNFLRKGWGVRIGPATKTELEFCNLAVIRTLTVVISREIFNTGSNDTQFDDIGKQLLEDIYEAQARFYEPDELLVEASVVKIDPTSTSGVESVNGSKLNFLSMEASFDFTIREPI